MGPSSAASPDSGVVVVVVVVVGKVADREITMLRRPFKGRNLGGIESHVLRPIMTALIAALGEVGCCR